MPRHTHKTEQKKSTQKSGLIEEAFPDVQTLVSWNAPGRPFKKRGRQFYLSVILIALPVEIIVFLFSQYLLMLVIAAIVFLSFTLASVPPPDFRYRISTQGIAVEDHFYIWSELYDFYFKIIEGHNVLLIRTQDVIPGELKITLGALKPEEVRKILVQFLPFREYVKPTFMEKSADWLSRTFPLEDEKPQES